MTGKTTTKTFDSLIRISKVGDRQRDGTLGSDEDQHSDNVRDITSHGYVVGRRFDAMNESGGTVFESPQWLAALDRVRNGHSNGVAVAYVDRYGRDVVGGLSYGDKLAEVGGLIMAGGRIYDLRDGDDRLAFTMMLAQGEHYLNTAKKRSKRTLKNMHNRGILNVVPYGYRRIGENADGVDPKTLVPHDEQAETVKAIFGMRGDGMTWAAITRALHEQGVPSPRGHEWWTAATLATLTANHVYLGEVKYGAKVTKHAHKPLVTEQQWLDAQPQARAVRNGKMKPGVAQSLLICSGCGGPLALRMNGKGLTFYGCRRSSAAGPCPAPVNGQAAVLDDYVDERVALALDGKLGLGVVNAKHDLVAATAALKTAKADLANYQQGTEGLPPDAIAAGMRTRWEAVEAAQGNYDAARLRADTADSLPPDGDAYRDLPVAKRNRVARFLIETAVLGPFTGGARRESVASARLALDFRR